MDRVTGERRRRQPAHTDAGRSLRKQGERPDVSWRIVAAAVLTTTVGMLPGFLPGALSVQLSGSLGIAVSGIGLIVGAFFAVSALASPLMGRVAERLGWVQSMRLASVGAAVALGLTPLVADSVATLGVVTVVGGVALSLAHPAVNLALARCTAAERQGLAYGYKHAAIPAASALGGLALPLIAIPAGWQWVYALAALVALGAALFVPRSPDRFEVQARRPDVEAADRLDASLTLLVVLAVGAGLGIFGMDGLATFLVPYAVEVGFAESTAGLLLALGSMLGIGMRLAAGWQIDRHAAGGLNAVVVFLGLGSVGLVFVASGVPWALVVGSLVAFAFGWGWSGLFTYAVVRLNPNAPATATGVSMTGIYVGAAAGPALFGVIADGISFTAAWAVMAAALAVGAVLTGVAAVRLRP